MIRHKLRTLGFATASAAVLCGGPAWALDGVVASIKPVHSLVAAVMEGVGEPELLVKGAASPHAYALRPSEARALEQAKVVFWVGEGMETFLAGPLETLGGNARVVELVKAHDLVELDFREGGPFEAHDHGDHEGHDHAHGHDQDDGDDHDGGDDHAHEGHGHEGHDHGAIDMHLWLDPSNAKAFVHEIEEALSAADPDNAATYEANADALNEKLDALIAETDAALAPVRGRGFVVFHDAYQYFENRFDIQAAGSITVSPEAIPGAQRLTDIRAKVAELGATCIFAEPQFEPRLISVVAEGTQARTGVLDPLGADLEDGPELYFELIRNLTTSLTTCLAGAS
ncbi:zinc ABC transporter substrate-binding protein ZnuA [Neoaquamicrobium sediminum]|uniref:zinc ABC transporter substrate-binding protein ZnuA n=1 Tax=Neoaquamicrobium sediminum TaxID=1849104 RepID=UPI001565C430|nr:zinc ABC transporter substrate-binding protein ZnuA [Mesorhizobium sediminum]NRC53596.1 zinc ABC transporter substrate-binding protein ZnuA [Mesorhizobium sediminum]